MGPPRNEFDVAALERALEHTENADAEAHKVYNNLGLAHTAAGQHRDALRAHREEKRACKRLASAPGAAPARLVDLAIAYRRTGDATLRVDAVNCAGGGIVTERTEIARLAHAQHEKALEVAISAVKTGAKGSRFEIQCCVTAIAQSALMIALATRDKEDFASVIGLCARAAAVTDQLSDEEAGGKEARLSLALSAAVNLAVALSGYGDKKRARMLFEATGVRARKERDWPNLARCVANLAEEAGDEGDWPLCVDFVDSWIEVAKEQNDEGEEADALRKRGTALFEMHRYEEARAALDRAALLGRDEDAREEARRNLQLVETEIDEIQQAERQLENLKPRCLATFERGDAIDEARARLSAGEVAFKLRRDSDVLEHLERYFELVDEHGCFPSTTGIESSRHCSAVTNMAETLWRTGRVPEAVEWGMRELAVFKDDIAGQAQAWCNIGVYLDDDGRYEQAKVALLKSIELAMEAGDDQLSDRAESNLKAVEECMLRRSAQVAGVSAGSHADIPLSEHRECSGERCTSNVPSAERAGADNGGRISTPGTRSGDGVDLVESRGPEEDYSVGSSGRDAGPTTEQSIVIDSQAVMNTSCGTSRAKRDRDLRFGRSEVNTACRSAVDGSSAGSWRCIDLCALYRKRCDAMSPGNATPWDEPKACLIEELRQLSGKLVACDDTDIVDVNFSETFLCDEEFVALMQACASLPPHGPGLRFNFRLNPLIGSSSIRWLSSAAMGGPPRSFTNIVALDLSGTGIDSDCLLMLARSLRSSGSLRNVATLAVGKNCFGKQPGMTAEAVAVLMLLGNRLESLDISLNLLPKAFLPLLLNIVERRRSAESDEAPLKPCLAKLDLRLNNRRSPDALLEYPEDPDVPAECLRRLLQAVPSLRVVDIRACGAPGPVRRKLFQLRKDLKQKGDPSAFGELYDDPVEVLVTSPEVFDEEEDAVMDSATA